MSDTGTGGTDRPTTAGLLHEVADEYGASTTVDKLCVKEVNLPHGVESICLPKGAHSVLDMLAERGLRVCEIPGGRPDCHGAGHHKRVYVQPIEDRKRRSVDTDTDPSDPNA